VNSVLGAVGWARLAVLPWGVASVHWKLRAPPSESRLWSPKTSMGVPTLKGAGLVRMDGTGGPFIDFVGSLTEPHAAQSVSNEESSLARLGIVTR
jgi:hypothetical protein